MELKIPQLKKMFFWILSLLAAAAILFAIFPNQISFLANFCYPKSNLQNSWKLLDTRIRKNPGDSPLSIIFKQNKDFKISSCSTLVEGEYHTIEERILEINLSFDNKGLVGVGCTAFNTQLQNQLKSSITRVGNESAKQFSYVIYGRNLILTDSEGNYYIFLQQ